MTNKEKNASLVDIFFGYLSYAYDQSPEVIESTLRRFKAKHLLDLYWVSFIPKELELTMNRDLPTKGTENVPQHVIHCISKLRKAWIKIRTPKKNGSSMFLAVKFRRQDNVIQMPTVTMNDFMCSFFTNCVA